MVGPDIGGRLCTAGSLALSLRRIAPSVARSPILAGMAGEGPTKVGRGSAVLVHGMWSNPDDWIWVCQRLLDAGVHVVVPDLPSHRSPTAGLAEDADEVRRAIRSCPASVVVAGWSYGGAVISMAAA